MTGRVKRSRAVAGLSASVAVVAGTAWLARRPVSRLEVHAFRSANELPDRAYPATWILMQYGTFGSVPAAALVALARRRPRLALAIGVAGSAGWLIAKAVKPIVGRARPAGVLDDVRLRGTEEGDQGFPSGHSAVSAAITVVSWSSLPLEWRIPAAALTAFVPFARMYVGAHLPLDVVGGSALGSAIGCVVNLATRPRGPAAV